MPSLNPRIDALQSSSQNLCVGGNFDIWQRNTTFTSPAHNTYTADRFVFEKVGAQTVTISRSTDVPTLAESGFQSLHSLLVTTTATAAQGSANYTVLTHKIEGFDYQNLHGSKFRKQFWVKASIAGTYTVSFRNSAVNRNYVTTAVVPSANVWTKVTIDLTGDTSGTWLFDNGVGLIVSWALAGGTNFQTSSLNTWQAGNLFTASTQTDMTATNSSTFRIAQVGIFHGDFTTGVAGNVDMPFKRAGKNIQQELAMCQRYYEKSHPLDTAPGTGAQQYSTIVTQIAAATQTGGIHPFAVLKRGTPAVVFYTADGSPTGSLTFRTAAGAETERTVTSIAHGYGLRFNTNALYAESWAYGDFTADAEL